MHRQALFSRNMSQKELGNRGTPNLPRAARDTFLPNSLAQRCSIMASDFNSLSHGGHTVVPRNGKGEKQEL